MLEKIAKYAFAFGLGGWGMVVTMVMSIYHSSESKLWNLFGLFGFIVFSFPFLVGLCGCIKEAIKISKEE